MEGKMFMEQKHAATIEKRKRSLYYQLIIIENYQKAINKELGQLVEWVRLYIQNIAIASEAEFCKNYEGAHDQLSQLCRSSKELYKMLQETKAGILFQQGMLANGPQTPTEKLLSIGVLASGSTSYIDGVAPADFLTNVKKNISMFIGEGSGSCSPKSDISKMYTSRVSNLYHEDITSESELHKLQKEELFVKHSSDSYSFTNSHPSGVDQPPEEGVSSNVYNELIVKKVEERLAIENSSCPSLQLWKEDPRIFSNKSKSTNDNQIYIAQSEWEVWDTFEFTASGSDTSGYVEPEEERSCNIQVVVSTLDVTSPPEPLSLNDTLWQPNPIEQVSTSKNDVFSPRQYLSPNSTLGPLTECQFSDSPVERDMEQLVASDIPEFQFCRWQEVEIRVSYAIDPHYFYIQHSGQELPEMMREVNIECSRSSTTMCCIPLISSYVCAWLPESKQWYRTRVIRIVGYEATITHENQHILVEVLCVDYGFSASLPLSCLKSLTPTYCVLPQQALRVSLANVSPINGAAWSRAEINWFKKFVKNKTFFSRLYQKLNIMTVELFSERGKIGIMRRGSKLSQKMAAAGLAIYLEGNCASPKVRTIIPLHWKQCLAKLLSKPTNL